MELPARGKPTARKAVTDQAPAQIKHGQGRSRGEHQFGLFHGSGHIFHEPQLKVRLVAQVFDGLKEAHF